ncbi:hypothetical protein O988_06837, partial [Pseudogymnoascus sp. VKM F-3808]
FSSKSHREPSSSSSSRQQQQQQQQQAPPAATLKSPAVGRKISKRNNESLPEPQQQQQNNSVERLQQQTGWQSNQSSGTLPSPQEQQQDDGLDPYLIREKEAEHQASARPGPTPAVPPVPAGGGPQPAAVQPATIPASLAATRQRGPLDRLHQPAPAASRTLPAPARAAAEPRQLRLHAAVPQSGGRLPTLPRLPLRSNRRLAAPALCPKLPGLYIPTAVPLSHRLREPGPAPRNTNAPVLVEHGTPFAARLAEPQVY